MQGIVFVPGISGSELIYKNAMPPIWPPKWTDLFVYRELDELLDPKDVSVGTVIDSVLGLIPIYETTEIDLQSISISINGGGANGPYLPAPYDWRIDLLTAVDNLAALIEGFSNSVDEISIVSHSMGGLLTRLLLEWKYSSTPPPSWLKKITRALFVCTPHLGAPTALARIFGLEVTEYVIQPDQMRQFAGDSHFPAVYQLMPSAQRGILFDTTSNNFIRYDDPGAIAAFGLSTQNLTALKNASAALNPSKKPTPVEYTFVYGTGQQTDERVNVAGLSLNGASPQQDDQGDGTVPIWSIVEAATLFTPPIQTHAFPGDHVGILATDPFRQFLYSYFGLSGPAPLVAEGPGVVVSLNKRTYKPGEPMSVLLIPDEEAAVLTGSLMLSRVTSDGGKAAQLGARQEIQFRGGPARSLSSKLVAPRTPGIYRLDFGGPNSSHKTTDKVAGWFAVSGPK
jgi:phospholipase A1